MLYIIWLIYCLWLGVEHSGVGFSGSCATLRKNSGLHSPLFSGDV